MGHDDEILVNQVLEQYGEGGLDVAVDGEGVGCLDADRRR